MNTLYITPPLTITREAIDEAVDALDTAHDVSDAEMVARGGATARSHRCRGSRVPFGGRP